MNFDEYQAKAMEFRLESADQAYVTFGLVGEVGELYGYFAKTIRDSDSTVDITHVKKELGDILWFISALASDMGLSLQMIADANILKLTLRAERGTIQGSGDDR
jgi:NTP pyrophosphatase (non-canonical NTP hydrolase)